MSHLLNPHVLVAIAITGILSPLSAAQANYAVLDGQPVTQGQMRIAKADLQRLEYGTESPSVQTPSSGTVVDRFVLEKTTVNADVSGVLARVRVEQVFRNPYAERLEASYVFPLPENGAVDRYAFQIGERVIRGVVKRRDEARQMYEQARDRGQAAALLEQERANIFSQSVANIPPNGTVTVYIEYVQPLDIDGDHYVFRFPMVVGPRFMPGTPVSAPQVGRGWARDTDQVPDASRISPVSLPDGMRNGNDVFINVKIDAGMPIQELTGVTHPISVSDETETTTQVTLQNQSTIADQDFVLEYRLAGEGTVLASLAHRTEQDGYFTLVLQPKWNIQEAELAPREVILLLDISGSMKGPSISQLRVFADRVLSQLHAQDTFRVAAFSNSVHEFQSAPVAATPQNISAARDFIRNLQAHGGTQMLPALQRVLMDNGDETSGTRYLYLLTDALVGNDHSILGYLREPQLDDVRVFPVCFGAAPNHYLIQRAADIGRGFAMQVTNQDNAAALADRFNAKTAAPYLTDIVIDWASLGVKDVIPARIPDLYADRPLIVTGRYAQPGSDSITLSGQVQGQPVTLAMPLELPEQEPAHDSLGSLWARLRIREIWNANVGGETRESIAEITEIGLEHQLVTQYTSFVAIEEEYPELLTGTLRQQSVQVLNPAGMTPQGNQSQLAQIAAAGPQSSASGIQHTANLTAAAPSTAGPATAQPTIAQPPATGSSGYAPPSPSPRSAAPRGFGSSGGGGGSVEWLFLAGLGVLGAGRLRTRRRDGLDVAA